MKSLSLASLSLLTIVLSTTGTIRAAEPDGRAWPEFRNGGKSQTNGELPLQWNWQTIRWQHELIGYGQSTPVIMHEHVFVTSVDGPMKDRCVISCYDLRTGQLEWSHQHPASAKAASNYMASRAAPTPVVDAQGVYAFFESGDLLAVDHRGQQLWQRCLSSDYGAFENNHGLGSSPTQTPTHVILNIEHKGPSYLIAIDKKSGVTSWKVERPSTSSWSSPIVVPGQREQQQVIVSSGGTVEAYAASSGEKLWSVGGLDGNSVPSPTPDGSLLFVGARVPEFGSDGQAARSNLCIDLQSIDDAAHSPQVKWRSEKAVSDYASPIVCGDCAYFLNKIGVLYCLDKNSGQLHYMQRLGTQCWATPIVIEDRIYFFGKDGKTQVIRAGSQFELLHSNSLWDEAQPPKPESYVEYVAARAESSADRGTEGGAADGKADDGKAGDGKAADGKAGGGRGGAAGGPGGGRGGGMLATLMKNDVDGDGRLSADEIPADFKPMLARVDTNGDGQLDANEMKAMAESFAARRGDSRDAARDPIVYGAAAVDGAIVIRTGTRLYCIAK